VGEETQGENRIRIVFLVHQLGLGGLENVVVDLANRLATLQFECTIINFSQSDPLQNRVQQERTRTIALDKKAGNDPALVYRLYRFFRRERPHIVQTHNWGALVEGVVAAKLARVPILIHAEHGTVEGRRYNVFLQRILWRAVQGVLCVSEEHRQRLSKTVGFSYENITPILNGVNTDFFRPCPANEETIRIDRGLEPDALYIGTVGNLRPVKNHRLMLQASRDICTKYERVRIVFIGEGSLKEDLIHLAKALGIYNQVKFLGARSDVRDLLNTLDIFVLPSLSEGLPISVLEAMACGLPVVATSVGGLPELIEDGKTGMLVPSQDESRLKSALEHLIRCEATRRTMGQAARKKVVERFSLDAMVNEYRNLYQTLIKQKSSTCADTSVAMTRL
jgi:sugar transferase (PEP-CTERM/EpsH1 system associated)